MLLTQKKQPELLDSSFFLQNPLYNISKSYIENAEYGPFFSGDIPERKIISPDNFIDFLGYKVASKIGIPAGPLLNAKWISLAGRLGFDILCYKTIRSSEFKGHPLPNMVYVEVNSPLIPGKLPPYLTLKSEIPRNIHEIAVTNSFGMPSRSPEYLIEDIAKANKSLAPGKIMIISVVGTPQKTGFSGFIQDFIRVSLQAVEYGAKIIEANFSCPNASTCEGELYTDPERVFEVTKKIAEAIAPIPLIIKIGTFTDPDLQEKVLIAIAKGGARAVCGINTIGMKVLNNQNFPALGPERATAGICGSPIRRAALDFIKNCTEINKKQSLSLTIMGTGGAMLSEHFSEFINAGADVAMTATGMLWNPYMAAEYHQKEYNGNQ